VGIIGMDFFKNNVLLVGSVLVMVLIIGYFWNKLEKQLKENPRQKSWSIDSFPEFCATLGVIFTFLGITYGLLNFDTENIVGSVPQLLEGMKFAFVTSIIGMISSAWLKSRRQKALNALEDNSVNEDATIADLINYNIQRAKKQDEFHEKILKNSADQNTATAFAITSAIRKLTKSIAGDGDSTLIGQIKVMRTDFNDNQIALKKEITNSNEKLIEEFRNFAKISAENNSKAFIEALNNSMKEFNNNLKEQFGENFKQLNIAVGKLLDWQEKYKDTVIEVTETQKEIFAGIEVARNSLESMANNSSGVEKSANELKNIIVTTSEYQEILENTLAKLNNATKDAEKFIPRVSELLETTLSACEEVQGTVASNIEKNSDSIQKQINTIGEQVSTVVEKNSNEIKNSSNDLLKTTLNVCEKTQESMEDNISLFQENFETLGRNVSTIVEKNSNEIKNSCNELLENALNACEKTQESIWLSVSKVQDNFEELGNKVANVVEKNSDEIKKNYLEANKHVENQVEKAVEEMSTITMLLEDAAKKQIDTIENVNNKSIDTINKVAENLAKNSFNVTKRVSDNIQTMVEENNKNLKITSENINKDFENRLNNALVAFGRELASISEKFANDYTPLTRELAKIVTISKNTNDMGDMRQ
jgi:ABC-type transporter Mla subunit MlaD